MLMPGGESRPSYAVTLSYHGLARSAAGPDGPCPGARLDGFDVLQGVVSRVESDGKPGAVVYEGVLQRTTEIASCGASSPASPRHPCHALLSGAGDVSVRIKVEDAKSGGGAWIVATPLDQLASVSGTCSPAQRREVKARYAERLTFEVGPALSDDLSPGSYAAESPDGGGPWALDVLPLERPSE